MARSKNNIVTLRHRTGLSQTQFCRYFRIPLKTLEKWEGAGRAISEYLYNVLERDIDAHPVRQQLEIYRVELAIHSDTESLVVHKALVKEAFRNPIVAANWAARVVRESSNVIGALVYQDLGVAEMLPLLEIENDGTQKKLGEMH